MPEAIGKPRASAAKVAYHQKQLTKMLARADDLAFLQMIWAVDALQSDREGAARPYLSVYPAEAALQSSLQSSFGIHRWELETLVVQLFLAPKDAHLAANNLSLDCSQFEAARQAVNRLRALENIKSSRYLVGDFNIWGEMHRIAQRQFHWQRGYFNMPQVYRYAYFYARGRCAEYFQQVYGFEITNLILVGFGLFTAYLGAPWQRRQQNFAPEIGLTEDVVRASACFFFRKSTHFQCSRACSSHIERGHNMRFEMRINEHAAGQLVIIPTHLQAAMLAVMTGAITKGGP